MQFKMIQKKSVKLFLLFIALFLSVNFFSKSEKNITLFLIGDSTMADKPLADNSERGWGQMFPAFFNEQIHIENYAKNGRSTKSFIDEGRWKTVFDKLEKGDYVFIQFGHNDAKKSDSTRYAAPQTDYKNNLLKFVKETKEKGAIPILITPVNRRKFDENGKLIDQHGDYPVVVRKVAADEKISLIDLHKKSEDLFNKLGVEKTKNIFLYDRKEKEQGKKDNTHFTQTGAIEVAKLVVEGIKELNLPITKYLVDSLPDYGKEKVVALDYYFNNEYKMVDGKKIRFHYIWEDQANSGYYEIGKLLTLYNADLTEFPEAPTKQKLDKTSIYIIVDPDTPAENPEPNYIDEQSIKNIVDWVKSGGVLVLLANDKGNCEFEHLNNLSKNFGIIFNEDSENKVTDNNYDMGKFINLPDHPIFKNVNKIYLKEISTLDINEPAKAILKDKNKIVMASSEIGSGFVFAVGDPWFYNEYFDNSKLPEGFENNKAAENLFKWLLSKSKKIK